MEMVPYQQELSPALPIVHGNVDYLEFRQTLERIDRLLIDGGVEDHLCRLRLAKHEKGERSLSERSLARLEKHTVRALRCNIARELTQESVREFSTRLADSALLQWFCKIDRLDAVRVPSKSTLDRYDKIVPEEIVRDLVDGLNADASSVNIDGRSPLGLAEPLATDDLFLDTSCVQANIHFPVDWVLLRDAVRTLMKAVSVIRRHGLKNRMNDPAEFIRSMNRLCIEMTHSRRHRPNSRKWRKKVLRQMKKLAKTVDRHAMKHRELLSTRWSETELSMKQAQVIIDRIDGIREQLPEAIRQAHERVIGGRLVPNEEKILSLYEPDVHVISRGKAGARVEFGNTLLLAEQSSGVIVDWQLIKDQAPADSKMVEESLDRFDRVFGKPPEAVVGDRGFDSKRNRRRLATRQVYNAICPRSVGDLRERMVEERFARLQRRRGQTEARIAIFKNGFLGRPLRSKGFMHRENRVAWSVLAHNLWVLARLPQAGEKLADLGVAA